MKKILGLALNLVPLFLLAYFLCDIKPEKSYVWYDGIWDGICFIPNLIFIYCGEARLFKAVEFTSGYNICWWIFTVVTISHIVKLIFNVLFGSSKK